MLDKIAFAARDPELVEYYYKSKESLSEKLAENKTKLVIASIQVRCNATTIMAGDWCSEIKDDIYPTYKTFKMLFETILAKSNRDMLLKGYCGRIKDDAKPDSDFWKSVSEEHHTIDGDKFPKDENLKKYDIDISLFINGCLIYHGWQLVGANHELSVTDAVETATALPVVGMCGDDDKPTEEEIKSFPW